MTHTNWLTRILSCLLVLGFCGCASMRPEDFSSKSPRFIPEQYFSGESVGHGLFFDRFGRVQLGFRVDLNGIWDGSVLTLHEVLLYDNGQKLERTYVIKKISEHLYEATTPDVVGTVRIESYGNALRWDYRLRQDIGGGSIWTLAFDDWMFLQEDGTVLNRAWASKFGIGLGEVMMSIRKKDGA